MNEVQNKDHHLNLFYFYGQSGRQYLEDNLTRGLAICLENDPIFLDRFLRKTMGKDYKDLFSTEGESEGIIINVQKRSKDFVGVQKVYGIPLTTQELSDFDNKDPKGAENPITDLSIQINEKLILIEVKRTKKDCRSQLLNQIEKIKLEMDDDIKINDLEDEISWGKLMELIRHTLKFQKEVNNTNLFTYDYYHFVKRQYPDWFESIPFSEIPFPKSLKEDSNAKELLEVRLNYIKQQMLDIWNKERDKEQELVFNRANIPVTEYNWVDEINIEPLIDNEEKKYIAVRVWPGDTKTQGYSIFGSEKSFDWPENLPDTKYKLRVEPYIKFSHMQGLCWVWTKDRENPITHTKSFFNTYSGKWKRDNDEKKWYRRGAEWEKFDEILESVNRNNEKGDWKKDSGWNEKIEDSQRSYFYVSLGFAIAVLILYQQVQNLDKQSKHEHYPLAKKLKEVSAELLLELDKQFSA